MGSGIALAFAIAAAGLPLAPTALSAYLAHSHWADSTMTGALSTLSATLGISSIIVLLGLKSTGRFLKMLQLVYFVFLCSSCAFMCLWISLFLSGRKVLELKVSIANLVLTLVSLIVGGSFLTFGLVQQSQQQLKERCDDKTFWQPELALQYPKSIVEKPSEATLISDLISSSHAMADGANHSVLPPATTGVNGHNNHNNYTISSIPYTPSIHETSGGDFVSPAQLSLPNSLQIGKTSEDVSRNGTLSVHRATNSTSTTISTLHKVIHKKSESLRSIVGGVFPSSPSSSTLRSQNIASSLRKKGSLKFQKQHRQMASLNAMGLGEIPHRKQIVPERRTVSSGADFDAWDIRHTEERLLWSLSTLAKDQWSSRGGSRQVSAGSGKSKLSMAPSSLSGCSSTMVINRQLNEAGFVAKEYQPPRELTIGKVRGSSLSSGYRDFSHDSSISGEAQLNEVSQYDREREV